MCSTFWFSYECSSGPALFTPPEVVYTFSKNDMYLCNIHKLTPISTYLMIFFYRLTVWKLLTTHEEEQSRHVLHEPTVPTASQHPNDPAEQDDGHGHSHESCGHSPQICGRQEKRQVKHGDSELIGGTACIRWVRWLIVNERRSASVDPKWLWFSYATFPGREF